MLENLTMNLIHACVYTYIQTHTQLFDKMQCLVFSTVPHLYLGYPESSVGKESACNAGDLGSILGLGRSPGEGKGYPLQYSHLENCMDCIVCGHKESDTTERLLLHFIYILESYQHNVLHDENKKK